MKQLLSWKSFGAAAGVLGAAYLGATTLFAAAGLRVMGFDIELAQKIYPALTPTTGGVFVALGIGLLCGIICGSVFSWLYNSLVMPQNLKYADRLGRLVVGFFLLYAGQYAGGIGGGIVFLIGAVSVAEAIIGYCYLAHLYH